MIYRRFGKTELSMPVFSCGGMRYQQAWQDVPAEELTKESNRNVESCIEAALSHGITHIETARGYGTSERQLGRILPRLPRERIIVQTKVAPSEDAADFERNVRDSISRLQLDHVDLLGLHGINNEDVLDWALRPGGCLEMARRLRDEGLCRYVGFSTHAPPDVIQRAVESDGFDYVNLHWYYVNPFTWPVIEAAARRDMGVFIISPSDKGGKLYEPPDKLVELCRPLTPMQFNDLFCLLRPQVHTLSIGAARASDFDEHVASLEFAGQTACVEEIADRLWSEQERVLGAEWVARWHEGLPRWQDAPGEINVHEIVRLWNLAQALDMTAFGRMRYNLLGSGGHWFPGSNAEHALELDWSQALRDSPFSDRLPAVLAEAHEMLYDKPVQRLSESG